MYILRTYVFNSYSCYICTYIIIYVYILVHILNENSLAVKKCVANQKQHNAIVNVYYLIKYALQFCNLKISVINYTSTFM